MGLFFTVACCVVWCVPGTAAPETLDRVVVSIGNTAVMESEILSEYRFELFLNGKDPRAIPDTPALESARDRLVDQKLLAIEEVTDVIAPEEIGKAASNRLTEIRRKFATEEAFQSSLQLLGLNVEEVLARLAEHEHILRLIDRRLRPEAVVESTEVEAYYLDTFVPQYSARGEGPPPALSEVEGQIREILTQKKIDELLSTWLKELKSAHRVTVHSF